LAIWFGAAAVEALTSPPDDRQARRRQTIGFCILGALLAASRYEGLFLIGLACLGFLARRQFLRGVSIGAAALLPVVIVNDLGAVTYYTQARILDLVGLGDTEPLEIMRRTLGQALGYRLKLRDPERVSELTTAAVGGNR
jgi:hypothetical protein